MGLALFLTTEDGSVGTKGLVTAALRPGWSTTAAAAISDHGLRPQRDVLGGRAAGAGPGIPCFISLEEQMACGIGVCLGCAIPARSRPFRYVCSNGPVFDAADVLDVGEPDRAACPPAPGDPS